MNKTHTYDIVIIGAGAGGLNIGIFMARAGFSVALITESEHAIGGDCLNTGCVPSKALIHAARDVAAGRRAGAYGFELTGELDWQAVRDQIDRPRKEIREHENSDWLRKQGVDPIIGYGRFADEANVEVNGEYYTAKKIVLASGSRPRELPVDGVDQVSELYTNESIFDIETFPKRLLVIGGGPIGCELGQAFHDLGAEVCILERGERIMSNEDEEVAGAFARKLQEQGVEIRTFTEAEAFTGASELRVRTGEQSTETLGFDAVFVGIGRVTDFRDMNLEAAGIKTDERGKLVVNDALETTNTRVMAVGDAAGGLQFTHATELHARVVISNFFSPFTKKVNTDAFAWVTYTHPEVATFGRQERQLKDDGVAYEVLAQSLSDDRAVIDEYDDGFIKLLVSPKGKILGGSIVAPQAGEMIQELILAVKQGISAEELIAKTYPYPVASRAQKDLLGSWVFKKKLTPGSKRMLHWLYASFA